MEGARLFADLFLGRMLARFMGAKSLARLSFVPQGGGGMMDIQGSEFRVGGPYGFSRITGVIEPLDEWHGFARKLRRRLERIAVPLCKSAVLSFGGKKCGDDARVELRARLALDLFQCRPRDPCGRGGLSSWRSWCRHGKQPPRRGIASPARPSG